MRASNYYMGDARYTKIATRPPTTKACRLVNYAAHRGKWWLGCHWVYGVVKDFYVAEVGATCRSTARNGTSPVNEMHVAQWRCSKHVARQLHKQVTTLVAAWLDLSSSLIARSAIGVESFAR